MSKPDQTDDLQNLERMLRYSKPKTEPLSPAFKLQLRADLLKNAASSKNSPAPRIKQLAFLATVMMILALFVIGLTPAGQVIADAFLRFGPFTLTDTPSAAEQHITATPETVYSVETTAMALSEADEQAGFAVYYPRYLPNNYSSNATPTVELVYNQQGKVSSIEAMFFSQDEQHILYYTQAPYTPDPSRSPFELGIGKAEAMPVMVGDSEGVWLEDFNWGADAHQNPVAYNMLIWQQTTPTGETFIFWLGSQEQLPLDEMLQIAKSMAPAGDSPANSLNIAFGNDITLLGFTLTDEELNLFWQINSPQARPLNSFVHWRDATGMVVTQIDRPHNARPEPSNRTIIETYNLRQTDLPPGTYTIFVGLYRPDTGERLTVPKFPNNEVRLTEVEVN